jgi:hypothetical protein
VRRGQALRVVLRTLARFGAAACANGSGDGGDVCSLSQSCGLLASGEGCDATAPLSGAEGVEILRRSLKLLGGS